MVPSSNTFDRGVTSSQPPNTVMRCGKDSRCGGRSRAQSWPPKGRVRCNLPTSLPHHGTSANKLTTPADEGQRDALQRVFSGQAGGFMATFAELIGEVRGLQYVPITFEVAVDLAYWRAEIPGQVVAAAEALSGPTTPPGARVQLLNPPGSEVGPGQVATWGKATANQVEAYGFQWNWAGKSSKHIPFDWTGPM
jgi:hypothetical protein